MMLVTIFMVVAFSIPMLAEGKCRVKGGQCCDQIPNLTASQKTKLQKLHIECQKKKISLKAELEKQKLDLKVLMKEQKSEKEVGGKIDEIHKIKAQLLKECYACYKAIRSLLNDEQKKHLHLKLCFRDCCAGSSKHCCHTGSASHNCSGKCRGQGGHKKGGCHPAKAAKCSAPTC